MNYKSRRKQIMRKQCAPDESCVASTLPTMCCMPCAIVCAVNMAHHDKVSECSFCNCFMHTHFTGQHTLQVQALERRLQMVMLDCKSMMQQTFARMSNKLDADFAHEPLIEVDS